MPRRRSAIIQSLVVSAFLLLLQPVTTQAQEAEPEDVWVVSIPHLALPPGERVVGFSVRLKTAMVSSLPKIPWGWSITIDNDLSWNTRVSGHIQVGVAAFEDENDASAFFRDFLVIERPPKEVSVRSQPFDLTIELMTTVDFDVTKHILLKKEKLLLRKQ